MFKCYFLNIAGHSFYGHWPVVWPWWEISQVERRGSDPAADESIHKGGPWDSRRRQLDGHQTTRGSHLLFHWLRDPQVPSEFHIYRTTASVIFCSTFNSMLLMTSSWTHDSSRRQCRNLCPLTFVILNTRWTCKAHFSQSLLINIVSHFTRCTALPGIVQIML